MERNCQVHSSPRAAVAPSPSPEGRDVAGVRPVADLFVSYAREDRARVAALVALFEGESWSVFWDHDIPPGGTWRSHIGRALQQARCVVVAWSERSVRSDWVIQEAEEGKERGVLVPV